MIKNKKLEMSSFLHTLHILFYLKFTIVFLPYKNRAKMNFGLLFPKKRMYF
ncbi:MAG: hypothetical protein RLZZ500_2597 [Bacteroidota bacterium]|jgi:hypothetical protein